MAEVVTKENIFADGRKRNDDESDVEEFIPGLSRQMAQSLLFNENNPKVLMATPPHSTLYGFESPRCNSDAPSQMSSPLFASFEPKKSEAGLSRKPNRNECRPNLNPVHIQQQLQLAQLLRLKRELLLRQHLAEVLRRKNGARSRSVGVGVGHGIGVSPPAWPRMQKPQIPSGSGTRAVFFNGPGTRRESTGTGVFLPRHIGTANEPKLKPACSRVLLPERVVQALNLDLDDLGAGAPTEQGNRSAVSSSQEIRLPREWTY